LTGWIEAEVQSVSGLSQEDITVIAMTKSQGAPLCSEQTNALAGMFTIGQFFLNCCSFFIGMVLDYLPKSILLSVTMVIEIIGLILLGISDTTGEKDQDYFYIAYSLLAVGGASTMLSSFPTSFLLKKYQAGLLAMISCLFDASSIIFSSERHSKINLVGQDMICYYYTQFGDSPFIFH